MGSDSVVFRPNYRHTSVIALLSTVVIVVLEVLAPELAMRPVTRAAMITGNNHVAFDPCTMWEAIGWPVRVSVMIWFTTFIILLAKGLRNRTAARSLTVAYLLAIILPVQHQLSWYSHCSSTVGKVEALVWLSAVVGMAIHQMIQQIGFPGSRTV